MLAVALWQGAHEIIPGKTEQIILYHMQGSQLFAKLLPEAVCSCSLVDPFQHQYLFIVDQCIAYYRRNAYHLWIFQRFQPDSLLIKHPGKFINFIHLQEIMPVSI